MSFMEVATRDGIIETFIMAAQKTIGEGVRLIKTLRLLCLSTTVEQNILTAILDEIYK